MADLPPRVDRPVVIASNRGPLAFNEEDGELVARRGAGGLVSALAPLVAGTDATWIAAAISDADRRAAVQGVVKADDLRVRLLAIDSATYRLAYDVVSNGALWFAHHGLWDLPREPVLDRGWDEAWAAYRAVNHAFAEAVADVAAEGAAVLVQDYHLCLVARRLQELRPDLDAVHFSHTPFAPPVWLRPLPRDHVSELLHGLAAHRSCGFHTERWADDYRLSAGELAGIGHPATFVSPLASDPDAVRATAGSLACDTALDRLEDEVGDRQVIGRVDRIELSKNLLRGFTAFAELLERHPEHRGRVTFVAYAYLSREGVPAYARYRELVEKEVSDINDRFGTDDWSPIRFDVDDDYPRSVALLRRADVLLVNPIRDGLNLVASEGALVSEHDAVLCLSPEAGAWERFGDDAVLTPPFDIAATADCLHRALTMPGEERRARAERLRLLAQERTPSDWLTDQLAVASGQQPPQ